MKHWITSFLLLTVFFSLHGQSYEAIQTVQSISHKIIIPENGTLKEALRLTQEWTEKVLRRHENFESIQLLLGDTEKDTIELLVLYKFKTEVTRSTNEVMQELIAASWPEEGAFEEFLANLHRYINPALNERSMYKELVLKD